jgi:hypothetical protein
VANDGKVSYRNVPTPDTRLVVCTGETDGLRLLQRCLWRAPLRDSELLQLSVHMCVHLACIHRTSIIPVSASAQYLAPELYDLGVPHMPADVYAMGILMWEVITGCRVFGDSTPSNIGERVKVCCICLHMRDVNPSLRVSSANDLKCPTTGRTESSYSWR